MARAIGFGQKGETPMDFDRHAEKRIVADPEGRPIEIVGPMAA